jgi:hypothetical protein
MNIVIRQPPTINLGGLLLPAVDDDSQNSYGQHGSYNLNTNHNFLLSVEIQLSKDSAFVQKRRCNLARKDLSIDFVLH